MLIKNIYPISEGTFTIGFDKKFIPFDNNIDKFEERSKGSLMVEIQPFLIELDDELILLDTGLGFQKNGIYQIEENIEKLGFKTNDISKVILSHLHKDHSGGCLKIENNLYKPMFPNATYYIRKDEWNYAIENDGKSFDRNFFEKLLDFGCVNFIEHESGYIDDYIYFELSGGHSKFHQVILVDSENISAFYGGDEASQHKQLLVRYVAKYDYNGERAALLRENYLKRGKESDWHFLFYHDLQKPSIEF